MVKNILATIGLAVVVKAAFEHYREFQELKREKQVSVQPSHLPNSSIKADGVRVFLIGRDSPY